MNVDRSEQNEREGGLLVSPESNNKRVCFDEQDDQVDFAVDDYDPESGTYGNDQQNGYNKRDIESFIMSNTSSHLIFDFSTYHEMIEVCGLK